MKDRVLELFDPAALAPPADEPPVPDLAAAGEAYTVLVAIRLRPSERGLLLERATLCGKSLSSYIRDTALGVTPIARPDRVTQQTALEINKLGVNLNQIARVANREGLQPVLKALAEVGPLIERVLKRLLE